MKKYFPVYVRVPLLFIIFFFIVEYMLGGTSSKPAFVDNPVVFILLGLFLFALIVVEVVAAATGKVLDRLMTPEERAEKAKLEARPFSETPWVRSFMKKITKSSTMDQEKELMMDHDYDGIKELDNDLPPWWVGLFWATAIFAVIYLLRFEVFDGDNQITEFEKDMAKAREQVEEYNKTATDRLSASDAKYLTDEASLAKGKQLFDTSCAVCHRTDGGGGIGPNLTDDHWILGGGVETIFHTISEGGRPNMGMVPWNGVFKPAEIEMLTSYVISLNGNQVIDPKASEGDIIWSKQELESSVQDSTTPVESVQDDTTSETETMGQVETNE